MQTTFNRIRALLQVLFITFIVWRSAETIYAQGTAFTYQGRLSNGSSPVNGVFDFVFTLYSDALTGTVLHGPITNSAVPVANGLFTSLVDFGPSVFVGGSNWLAIAVSPSGSNSFSLLAPRQQITPTPYAFNVVGTVNTTQLVGTIPASSVSGLNSSATAPTGMVLIPGGTFTMGNSIGDNDVYIPPTETTISPFYMEVNLVNWSQWQAVYNWAGLVGGYSFVHTGTAKNSGSNQPVQTLDWYDCIKWCNARSEQMGLVPVYYSDAGLTSVYRTGESNVFPNWAVKGFRLPTEAEWERAARAGLNGQRFPWGNTIAEKQANYRSYPGGYDVGPNGYNAIGSIGGYPAGWPYTTPVGSFAPNAYGLFDMAGNLSQWCWDWYGDQYAGGTNPKGPISGSTRVIRGGNWLNSASHARCFFRDTGDPSSSNDLIVGFRTVLPAGL